MGRTYHMTNGKWSIEVIRSSLPGHLTGWLVNIRSGNRYVFSIMDDRVSYRKDPKPPTNIPAYMDQFLLDIRDSILKDDTYAAMRVRCRDNGASSK